MGSTRGSRRCWQTRPINRRALCERQSRARRDARHHHASGCDITYARIRVHCCSGICGLPGVRRYCVAQPQSQRQPSRTRSGVRAFRCCVLGYKWLIYNTPCNYLSRVSHGTRERDTARAAAGRRRAGGRGERASETERRGAHPHTLTHPHSDTLRINYCVCVESVCVCASSYDHTVSQFITPLTHQRSKAMRGPPCGGLSASWQSAWSALVPWGPSGSTARRRGAASLSSMVAWPVGCPSSRGSGSVTSRWS